MVRRSRPVLLFFFNDTATTEIYTLSLHDALPISRRKRLADGGHEWTLGRGSYAVRSEEHTSELQSRLHLVCRLLLEKKNNNTSDAQDSMTQSTLNRGHGRRTRT